LNPSAIRLYQAQGYFPQGREEDYYAPGVHALTYAKALPKSRSTPAPEAPSRVKIAVRVK
jgi:hypothetical protein